MLLGVSWEFCKLYSLTKENGVEGEDGGVTEGPHMSFVNEDD